VRLEPRALVVLRERAQVLQCCRTEPREPRQVVLGDAVSATTAATTAAAMTRR
jgi:hypothetical protein